ncbi:hypothetical protein Acr_08g0018330 [Actinidia rufa]|uniref:Uncharacterized protein n=1 Tax=Actinidia rufa TaxID=165716 RepID=A0A7J0F695_9ERIC|nr:hypothetical protein Acr_08g0018330 [Actinidia rufa]
MDSSIVNAPKTMETDLKLDIVSMRGLQLPRGKVLHKLERFKVRTVNVDGVVVVKEDKK